MSDQRQVLPDALGTPLCWIYSTDGQVLLDSQGNSVNTFVQSFEYTYDEESDDSCNIEFLFPTVEHLDLHFFTQDLVIKVQWGYILPNQMVLRSPVRKVAIRDISTEYSTKGLKMVLECTDLIAYLKLFKTTTTKKYDNPNFAMDLANIRTDEDGYLSYMKEIADGLFAVTITLPKTTYHINTAGLVKAFEYNRKTGKRTAMQESTVAGKNRVIPFYGKEVIKGKGDSLFNTLEALHRTNMDGGAPYITHGTDDELSVIQRNYDQDPFVSFSWAGAYGELIKFKPASNTKKVKADTLKNSGVDPYTKKIEDNQVDTSDGSNPSKAGYEETFSETQDRLLDPAPREVAPVNSTTSDDLQGDALGSLNQKIINWKEDPEEVADAATPMSQTQDSLVVAEFHKNSRENYEHNLNNLDKQVAMPGIRFADHQNNPNSKSIWERDQLYKYDISNFTAQEFISAPIWQKFINQSIGTKEANFMKTQTLISNVVERIQRKHEATATIIGDPSIIKSKTYLFENLSKKHSGIWYATSVTHKLTLTAGYITTMKVIKKPATIVLSTKSWSALLSMEQTEDAEVTLSSTITDELIELYKSEPVSATNQDSIDEQPDGNSDDVESRLTDVEARIGSLNEDTAVLGDNVAQQEQTQPS